MNHVPANKALLIVLALILTLGTCALVGCSSPSDEETYKKDVKAALDEYDAAYADTTNRILDELGSIDNKKELTQKDIDTIHDITSEFEDKATAALDKLASLDAPDAYKEEQKIFKNYAEGVKEITVPGVVGPLNELKAGQTLEDFTTKNYTPSSDQTAELKKLNEEVTQTLKTLGIQTGTNNSTSDK